MQSFSMKINALGVVAKVNSCLGKMLSTISVGQKARNYIKLGCSYFLLYSSVATAHNLGVVAATFDIKEQCFLEMIQVRLSGLGYDGILKHQKKIQSIARRKVERPVGVSLPRASVNRRFVFDPSITTEVNIRGADGEVLIKKGTSANPLDFVSLSQHLLFFDGDDKKQVAYVSAKSGLLIATSGSPLELEAQLGRRVYFDQAGVMVKKFGIKAVPAMVSQNGDKLIVEEVVL